MDANKDYYALYLKYKAKYLALKSGGAIIVARRLANSSKKRSSSSSSSSSSNKPIIPTFKTKFGVIDSNDSRYTYVTEQCKKQFPNEPDKICTSEEFINTFNVLMAAQLRLDYADYASKYQELLLRINEATKEWANVIKKAVDENKACKSKIIGFRCTDLTSLDDKYVSK